MKKSELMDKLVERVEGLSQDKASLIINEIFSIIGEALVTGDSYSQDKFGTLKVVKRAARKGRNPQTGAEVTIPEKLAVKLIVSGALKDKLNGK